MALSILELKFSKGLKSRNFWFFITFSLKTFSRLVYWGGVMRTTLDN
ncbi:hypothetical protein Ataiwa_28940 [Algoriphagus taiwanensis]|uniref:DUF805 domain-containing protein n=1 Tax=Algoriphagus taiwanensis TaxID=1445656 RepID=A0ABQ6Q428_9BACT|nr:hypothetical protein Ataiwa_28940 [Algoriphagus taiwanensis]